MSPTAPRAQPTPLDRLEGRPRQPERADPQHSLPSHDGGSPGLLEQAQPYLLMGYAQLDAFGREKPFSAVAAAFAVGAFVGWLIRR